MGTSYDGDPDLWEPSVIIPDDGDPRNAATLGIPFEGLLNRTAYLHKRRLIPFTSTAQMQATTPRSEGDTYLVSANSSIYRYKLGDIAANDPYGAVLRPDDGVGQFVLIASRPKPWLVHFASNIPVAPGNTTLSATPVALVASIDSSGCVEGEYLEVDATGSILSESGSLVQDAAAYLHVGLYQQNDTTLIAYGSKVGIYNGHATAVVPPSASGVSRLLYYITAGDIASGTTLKIKVEAAKNATGAGGFVSTGQCTSLSVKRYRL